MNTQQSKKARTHCVAQARFGFYLFVGLPFALFCTSPISAAEWDTPLTEHGQPNLQGIWYFGSAMDFERPEHLGMQKVYTDAEVIQIEKQNQLAEAERFEPLDPSRTAPAAGGQISQQADRNFAFFPILLEKVNDEYRTSMVIDPPNGRIPYRTEPLGAGLSDPDRGDALGPEGLRTSTRCLMWGRVIPIMSPLGWNANLQIVQTPKYVMMMTEMIHDVRIIRLDSAHGSSPIRNWMGDSIGHWEENTLVVHTRDFRLKQSQSRMPVSEDFELVERFTLTDDNEIFYSYTVTDDKSYTQPFTVERTFSRRPKSEPIYEFACHEGNHSIIGILAGARRQESNAVSTEQTLE